MNRFKFGVLKCFLSVVAAGFLVGTVFSQTVCFAESVRLLILPFEISAENSQAFDLRDGIAELLNVFFSQVRGISVIEREAIENMLKEQNISLQGIVADHERIKIGKIVGAQDMIAGSIHMAAGGLEVTARVFDISTGQLIGTATVSGSSADLAGLAKNMAAELSKALFKSGPEVSTDFPIDQSPLANLHFMKGLSAYYSARYDRAIPEFIQASQEETIRNISRFWLAKSFLSQKQYAQAYVELNDLSTQTAFTQKVQEIERMRKECEAVLSDEDKNFIKLIGPKP